MRFIPRKYRFSLGLAVAAHLAAFSLLVMAATRPERAQLGAGDGRTIVEVSLMEPEPPKPKSTPALERKERKREPEPKSTPEPKATPAPKPDPTPEPTQKKPDPTPKPKRTEAPKPTPKPRKTAKPTPPEIEPPKEEVKKEEKKSSKSALSPSEARKLRPVPTPESPKPSKPKAPARTPDRDRPSSSGSSSSTSSSSNKEVSSGATSLKGMGLPDYYARAALGKLSKFFQVPPDKQREAKAILVCRIGRDGMISNVRILKSSGDGTLDDMAITALERTRRFNPFPDDFEKSHVDVEISFLFHQ